MDWEALLKSVVLAAAISGVVAIIGFWVSAATAKKINQDKLKLDKELAEQKAASELALAERRTELDRKLALAKRRAEVAEEVLSNFYQLRKAFEAIRSPMIWAGEMVEEEGVSDDVIKNDGYGVIRRLRQNAEFISKWEAGRFTFGALFGAAAAAPYDEIIKVHNRVAHAAQDILEYRGDRHTEIREHLREMRQTAFAGREVDPIKDVIERAVSDIEATCRPALESELAAEAIGREHGDRSAPYS